MTLMKRFFTLLSLLILSTSSYSSPNDAWLSLARSFKLKDQSNQYDVKKQIKWLLAHPTYMDDFAKNSAPYLHHILEEIKKRQLPGELALVPMIESNYNPFAYSHAGAAGLWQLMPGTSSGLGIKQNWWYDGRRGVVSSTNAALTHMGYLNRFFKGNWVLAIAAYDAGEGTVQRALRKNSAANRSTDFWNLPLPKETKAYLPRLLAMASLIKYPRYFGISLPKMPYQPYFSQVPIDTQINLRQAAKLSNIPYDEILKLNPGYNRWTTSPVKGSDFLLLPLNKTQTFKDNLNKLPENQLVGWMRYEVKNGDNLSTIALKNHSRINIIKDINHLKDYSLKVGTKLIIPKTNKPNMSSLSETKRDLAINHSMNKGPKQIIHVTQTGDTLSSVGKKYNVSIAQLIYWNRLRQQKLSPMQKLQIWKSNKQKAIQTYQVKLGDSLGKIAQRFHLSLKKLKQLNPETNKKVIKPKQKLVLN